MSDRALSSVSSNLFERYHPNLNHFTRQTCLIPPSRLHRDPTCPNRKPCNTSTITAFSTLASSPRGEDNPYLVLRRLINTNPEHTVGTPMGIIIVDGEDLPGWSG